MAHLPALGAPRRGPSRLPVRRPAPEPAARLDGATARGFAQPTVLDGLRELAAVVGPVHALDAWSAACNDLGLHGMDLPPLQHLQAAEWLVEHAPVPAVRAVARSITTRLRAYEVLARTPAPLSGAPLPDLPPFAVDPPTVVQDALPRLDVRPVVSPEDPR